MSFFQRSFLARSHFDSRLRSCLFRHASILPFLPESEILRPDYIPAPNGAEKPACFRNALRGASGANIDLSPVSALVQNYSLR